MSTLEEAIASPATPGTPHFQPFTVTADLTAAADESISHYPEPRSATLPLLHLVQHRFGFISAAAIDWVASKLALEPIKVLEVVTFYPGFRQTAPGKFHIRVCRTLSCAMGGSHELMERLCELTGIDRSHCDPHHHPHRRFSVREVLRGVRRMPGLLRHRAGVHGQRRFPRRHQRGKGC